MSRPAPSSVPGQAPLGVPIVLIIGAGQCAYSASKFAVRGFSNALCHELERRQARILVGSDARLVVLLERLSPVHYWKLLRNAAGI